MGKFCAWFHLNRVWALAHDFYDAKFFVKFKWRLILDQLWKNLSREMRQNLSTLFGYNGEKRREDQRGTGQKGKQNNSLIWMQEKRRNLFKLSGFGVKIRIKKTYCKHLVSFLSEYLCFWMEKIWFWRENLSAFPFFSLHLLAYFSNQVRDMSFLFIFFSILFIRLNSNRMLNKYLSKEVVAPIILTNLSFK